MPENPASPTKNRIPASDLGDKVGASRDAILSILRVRLKTGSFFLALALISLMQDTDWPKEASHDVLDLIQTTETLVNLDQLPQDKKCALGENHSAVDLLLGWVDARYLTPLSLLTCLPHLFLKATGKGAREVDRRVGEVRHQKERISERGQKAFVPDTPERMQQSLEGMPNRHGGELRAP